MRYGILACILVVMTACGWRCAYGTSWSTIALPFVGGDANGILTAQLAQQIEQQGLYHLAEHDADYTLSVKIIDSKYENIGFRFDPASNPLDLESDKLIPNETRAKILAEVILIDNATNKTVRGPAHILATLDYDHQNFSLNQNTNTFSLGQLSDIDTTKGVVNIPLYRNLAHEIATWLGKEGVPRACVDVNGDVNGDV